MNNLTYSQVGTAIKGFGSYRTRRTQKVAAMGAPDGISGATLIALGLRETYLKNVNGGAMWDAEANEWVEAPPEHEDSGVFQISRDHHAAELKLMPAVKEGTWYPIIDGKTAFAPGYCPRFENALQFTLTEMHEAQAYAGDHDVPDDFLVTFAIAAHNAGMGGAMRGYHEGNVDRYTAGGDYSTWVRFHRKVVQHWLADHPKWKWTPPQP